MRPGGVLEESGGVLEASRSYLLAFLKGLKHAVGRLKVARRRGAKHLSVLVTGPAMF